MDKDINLMKYKIVYLIISAVVLVPGIVSLFLFGMRLSIDFSGGSVFKYENNKMLTEGSISSFLNEAGIEVENINYDREMMIIRTKPVDHQKIEEVKASISDKFGQPKLLSFETVGPTIGKETTKNAFVALFWASFGILVYIAYAFRNIPKPYSSFRFGASAIIAMLHDAFLVLGIFSLLGHYKKIEIDALFITSVLTVIGFSVHDTIVVFDRIRENLAKLPRNWPFERVVNFSVVETLNRSLATSMTVIITLLALFLLGGESIRIFVLSMLIGIVSGTYSSIFTASPILVLWEDFILRRKNH